MTQYYIVKDRANDYSIRVGLNGIIVRSFTTRLAAMKFIQSCYGNESL